MRSLAAVLIVLTAACATGKRNDAPSEVGSYALARIDNRPLPTRSPTEPNVTVERGTLILGRGGAFALMLAARTSPQFPPAEQTMRGSYAVSGDSLTVTPPDAAAPVVYRFSRAGVQLTLRDEQGHRYEFVVR